MNNIFQNAIEIKDILPQSKRFTLVGGCFDLIHVGHLHLLEYAASLEELLIVAVLSDGYAQSYKNSQQPIINQKQRAKMVASIRFVDFVYISDTSPSNPETLELLKPNSVVFGEESGNEKKVKERMKNISTYSPNTKIRFLPRYNEEEVSTSYIVNKIKGVKI